MNLNIAANLRGPALVTWRGASFLHRKPLDLPMKRETINFDDFEAFPVVFRSHDRVSQAINFTGLGQLSEISSLINRYSTARRGDLINIEEYPVTITNASDLLTCATDHLLADGDEVMVHWLVTAPSGLSKTTRYYARVTGNSSTTLKLYDTKAHAQDTGSTTGLVNIASDGSGVILDIARPLVLHFINGLRITYYNVGLTKLPTLNFSGAETLLDACEFTVFVRNGHDPDDPSAAFMAYDYAAFTAPSFDPADVPRQSPVITWANGSPWSDGLSTRAGAKAEFELMTEDDESDAWGKGMLGKYFKAIDVKVTAAVKGVTEAEAASALKAQSGTRGGDLGGDGALDIDTTAYNLELADAALIDAPQQATATDQRGKDFVWQAVPKFTAGALDPLYELTEN